MARLSLEEIIASDPRFKNVDINKARAYYNDAMNERNNTTVLPEFTVTAKRKNPKKVIPTESESNFFNRINVAKEDERINKIFNTEQAIQELAYTTPILGDALSLYDVGKDIVDKNYLSAAIGAGMFFLPNIVERPLKYLGKKAYRSFKYLKGKTNSTIDILKGNNIDRVKTFKTNIQKAADIQQNKENALMLKRSNIQNELFNLSEHNKRLDNQLIYLNNGPIRYTALNSMPMSYTIPLKKAPIKTNKIDFYKDEFENTHKIIIPNNTRETITIPKTYVYSPKSPSHITINTESYLSNEKSNDLIRLAKEREIRLNQLLQGKGKLAGSSKLASNGYSTHIPGDDDIITTKEEYKNLLNLLEGTENRTLRDNVGYNISSKKLRGIDQDIDIIDSDDLTGKAKGKLAHELYSFLYPAKYNKLRNEISRKEALSHNNNFDFADYNLDVTAKELYDALDNDILVKKSMSDLLFSHNPKHTQRRLELLANPVNSKLINELIDKKYISLFGKPLKLPKTFNATDAKNIKFLQHYNLPEELLNDKDAMETLAKYYYLTNGVHTRRTNLNTLNNFNDEIYENSLNSSINAVYAPSNVDLAGRGGNYTTGNQGGGTIFGDYLSAVSDDIDDDILNLVDLHNKYDTKKHKLTNEEKISLKTAFPDINTKFENTYELLNNKQIPNTPEANNKLADILNRKFLKGNDFNNHTYIGRLKPANLVGELYSPSKLSFEHGYLEPFNSEIQNKKVISIDEAFNTLRTTTTKGNAFQRDYMKAIKQAKQNKKISKNIKKEIKSNRTKIQNYSDEVDKLLKDIDFVNSRRNEILNNKRFSIKKEKRRTKKYRIAAGLISSGLGIAGEELIRRNLED